MDDKPAIAPGKYRISCPFSRTDWYLTVERGATEEDKLLGRRLKVSETVMPEKGGKPNVYTVPHGKVRFDFIADTDSVSVFCMFTEMEDEEMFFRPYEERDPYTSATDIVHHSTFKHLFGTQVVSEAR